MTEPEGPTSAGSREGTQSGGGTAAAADCPMHVALAAALDRLPLAPNAKWRHGVFDVEVFRKGGVSAAVFAPRIEDLQTPHDEDELYLIASGSGELDVDGDPVRFAPGDLIYVPAGVPHRFTGPLDELVAWVVFLPA